ncbi:MAG: hypothetical protein WCF67_17720 [Chitinophagaceae bacterium]
MDLLLVPFEGIGPLKLGIPRQAMLDSIGGEIVTMPWTKAAKHRPKTPLTDYFYLYEAKVEYDRNDRSIFIEVGSLYPVIFGNRNLFDLSYEELLRFFLSIDPAVVIEPLGFTSNNLQIAIYAPDGVKDTRVPCELVSVFVKGYYETDMY